LRFAGSLATKGFHVRTLVTILLVLLLCPAAVAASTSSRDAAARSQMVETTSSYGPNAQDTMRLFAQKGTSTHPAVLFIHGGGWTRSQPTAVEIGVGRRLEARTGWDVAVIGYPASTPPLWKVEPAAVLLALGVLGRERGVDPRRVAIWGESAGAQLGLLTAYRRAVHSRPPVRAVVSISGPTNMTTEFTSNLELWFGAVLAFEGLLPLADGLLGPSRYAETSPMTHVTSTSPPTFQAVSLDDPLIPQAQIAQLAHRLKAHQIRHRTFHVPGSQHATAVESETPIGQHSTVESLAIVFIRAAFIGHK
jgi:acetyl esterase/lipase